MNNKSQAVILVKEQNQDSFVIPTNNPNSEIAPDGNGKLLQEYDFSTKQFKAIYVPSKSDWDKGIVILKVVDHDAETSTIIELKLVEYIFPADIEIKDNKFLKFKKYERFKDTNLNLVFDFKLFYIDEEKEEYILLERNNNIFKKAPSLSILLSDNVLNEIKVIRELEYKLMISLSSKDPNFLDSTFEVTIA